MMRLFKSSSDTNTHKHIISNLSLIRTHLVNKIEPFIIINTKDSIGSEQVS